MQVEGELLATLSPPFHLPGPGFGSEGGLTILMCMVGNVLNGDLEVAWTSGGSRGPQPASNHLMRGEDGTQTTTSVILVASSEWESYICFVSRRRMAKVTQTQYVGFPNKSTGESPCRCWTLNKPFLIVLWNVSLEMTRRNSVFRFRTRA